MKYSLMDAWLLPFYEPVRRNKDGWRFHRHRFPIKGGISHKQVMAFELAEQMQRPSWFFKRKPNFQINEGSN